MATQHQNQRLSRLLTTWICKCQNARPPAYGSLNADELRFILPDLCLIDVLDDGGYRFRTAGAGIVKRLRHDPTGQRLGVLGSQAAYAAGELFAATVTHAAPVSASGRLELAGGDQHVEVLSLPLTDVNGVVCALMVGLCFGDQVDVGNEVFAIPATTPRAANDDHPWH